MTNFYKKTIITLFAMTLSCGALHASFFSKEVQPEPVKEKSEPVKEKTVVYPDFTVVAAKAIPAVVSVGIQYTAKLTGLDGLDQDSTDPFGSDFWQRFFGVPKRDGRSSLQPELVGQGSGVVISEDGYILTNNHIVADAKKIIVTMNDGQEYTGKVVGQDENTDLAVIKINATDLPHLKLGDSDDLKVGQWVMAIGNPLGFEATATAGIVSAKGRSNLGLAQFEDFIQTDASINRGNSGGALVNLDGELVGIPTAIATSTGGYMGIGFAIPSNMASQIIEQLIQDGSVTRGFLGVTLQKVDKDLAAAFGVEKTNGALVAEVATDSPSDKAGLKPGDIIVRYNGITIDNISHFRNAVAMMKPGTAITLDILRSGKPMTIKLSVGNHPYNITQEASDNANKLGLQVEAITPELVDKLSLKDQQGVVVTKVSPGSLAEMTGIKKGSVIVQINNQKITTVDQYHQAIKSTEAGKPILLYLKQGNGFRFVSIKSE